MNDVFGSEVQLGSASSGGVAFDPQPTGSSALSCPDSSPCRHVGLLFSWTPGYNDISKHSTRRDEGDFHGFDQKDGQGQKIEKGIQVDHGSARGLLPHRADAIKDPNDPVVRAMRENQGRWVGWNEATREVYVITRDFNEAMAKIPDPDNPDVHLDMAPGFPPEADVHYPINLLKWETKDIVADLRRFLGDFTDTWFDTPTPMVGNRTPRSLVGSDDEWLLRDILRELHYPGVS